MMNIEQLTKLQTIEYVLRIISDYNEAIAQPCMSDYKKERAKINAFDEILKEVEWCENRLRR